MLLFSHWLSESKKTIRLWRFQDWAVLITILFGSFFRLYNLADSLQFLGDQGRDALVVARIFKEFDPVFIGPVTSVGNMYLGPLYYYFMVPWLWLSYPSPLGPQYAIAFVGILTNWLVWVLGKRMVGKVPAAIAAALFAFSHVVVEYTRFSWNPNPIPLVSLLMMYSTFRAYKGAYWHWALVGLYGSVILQLHYMAALTGIAALLVWLYQFWKARTDRKAVNEMVKYAVLAGFILVLSFTPLALFDYRNGWINTKAFSELVTGSENFGAAVESDQVSEIIQTLKESHGRSMHILFEVFIGKQRTLNTALVALYLFITSGVLLSKKGRTVLKDAPGLLIVLVWFFIGVFGTSVYKHTVFDHYIGFEYPVAALLSGFVLYQLVKLHRVMVALVLAGLCMFVVYNVPKMPLNSAGWSIYDMEHVSMAIADKVALGEKYNIVLFSHSKDLYGMNYRYYLETTKKQPVREQNWTEADTLFVIDEERTGRDVLSAPVHEIVTFPSKQPVDMFEIDGVQVWVLRAPKTQD